MNDRREYEMTQAQYDAILAASQPVPYLIANGTEPSSPRENAERAWDALGRELGFKWLTVKPLPEKGTRFFTAEPASDAYVALMTPCPVCGSIEECPHTPVRCQHRWWSWGKPYSVGARTDVTRWVEGEQRECEYCGRIERAVISWNTVKA